MSTFVGRQDALSRLAAALAATGGSGWRRPALALVSGEAGIGKTALLARFTADATAAGARTAWGTCWNGEQAPAYWPWTQVLRCLDDHGPQAGPATVPAESLLDAGPAGGDGAAAGCASSTRSPACWRQPSVRDPWWSCSTTSTGPTTPAWNCCGSSPV
ncbi:AAA family ATPase [Catellatospora coxensis]